MKYKDSIIEILHLLNKHAGDGVIKTIMLKVKETIDCHSIAIRLKTNGNYPYYSYTGFSNEFIKSENDIVCHETECLCDLVLSGSIVSKYPRNITVNGGFWNNDISKLNISRNTCYLSGYHSIGLFPFKGNKDIFILGLLQINHLSPGFFTPELIEYIETISNAISVAVNRVKYEKTFLENARLRAMVKLSETISHEISQPLMVLVNELAMLKDDIGELKCPLDTKLIIDYIERIRLCETAGSQITKVLRNVQGISQYKTYKFGGSEFIDLRNSVRVI